MLNLITFNRWWDTGKVEEVYLRPYKRELYYDLEKFLDTRQILLIYGVRRVGKTTLMYQLIDSLLKTGVSKKYVLYFSFDEKIASLEEVFKTYSELVLGRDVLREKRIYVFLDEIQKLGNWQEQLKIFYDLYPNMKFIVSGSTSLVIFKGVKESLAGRVYEFTLPLLGFAEYLNLWGEKIELTNVFNLTELKEIYLKKERLSPLLFSYLKTGGFIEVHKEDDEFKIKEYSKSILERVIFSDIPLSFKIKEPQMLRAIIELVASNPGFLLDYSKLAETLKIDQRVVAQYVFYLKYSLLIKIAYNFSGSRFASERKLKKIYLTSTNFIYQFYPERFTDPDFLGKVIENLIVSSSKSEFFWRERQQNEVDLVLDKNIPLEIKYKTNIIKDDLKSILRFSQRFNSPEAIILTKDDLKQEKINGTKIFFIPIWIYLLTSVKNKK